VIKILTHAVDINDGNTSLRMQAVHRTAV